MGNNLLPGFYFDSFFRIGPVLTAAPIDIRPIRWKRQRKLSRLQRVADISSFYLLLGKKENEIPGCEGAATVAVCEAIIASAESGNPETVKYLN